MKMHIVKTEHVLQPKSYYQLFTRLHDNAVVTTRTQANRTGMHKARPPDVHFACQLDHIWQALCPIWTYSTSEACVN